MPAALLLVVVLAGTTCELNPLEPRFRAALQKLLTLLPPGNLVDSGSNSGGESCWLANHGSPRARFMRLTRRLRG